MQPREIVSAERMVHSTLLLPRNFEEDKNFLALKKVMPAVGSINKEILLEQRVIRISREESISIPGIMGSKTHHLIYGALLSMEKMETADFVGWADQLIVIAEETNIKVVSIRFPREFQLDKVRKILECKFSGTGIVVIMTPNDDNKGDKRSKAEDKKSTITIGSALSYADMLKTLVAGVSPEECGVKVNRIRETANGEVRLTVTERKTGGRQLLMEKIEKTLPGDSNRVKAHVDYAGAVIKDISAEVTKEQIRESICQTAKVTAAEVRLGEFRDVYRGIKMISAFVPHTHLGRLLNTGRIKIGWTMCRIRERVEPDVCTKCRRLGHVFKQCTWDTVVKRCCYKCGSEKHLVKDCKNQEKCPACDVTGHRENSMRCPLYREMVYKKKGIIHAE